MTQLGSDTCVLDLVELVYAAGSDPTLWPAFVGQVHALVPGGTCHTLVDIAGTPLISNSASAGYSEDFLSSYFAEYHAINPYNKIFASLPTGRVFEAGELGPPGWLLREEFFHDWLRPAGNFTRGVGVVLARGSVRQLRVTIDLPDHLGHLERDCAHLLRRLSPHIARAFEVNDRLRASVASSDALSRAFDQISDAALIIGLQGSIVEMNAHAQALLRSGLLVKLHNGKHLAFQNPDYQTAYQHALREALDTARTGAPCAFPIADAHHPNATALVLPLRRQRESLAQTTCLPLALVTIRTANARNPAPQVLLRRLYGLSRAESEVACLIAAGHDTREIAEQLALSHTTIRNQLASAMSKMGVRRQAQVVAGVLELQPKLSLEGK